MPILSKSAMDHLIRMEMAKLDENEVVPECKLLKWDRKALENPLLSTLRLLRSPDYIYFTCKYVLNLRLLPYQQVILQEMWSSTFPMLVASRGAGKSFLLAVYAILRALWIQGRKVVITGSGFRQAKTIMNYIETVYHNSPVLRSLVSENSQSGPHHDADRWVMRLGDSTITALPLGDGQKIRGERAHDIIADEFACVDATTLVETTYGLKRIEDCHENVTDLRLFSGDGDEIDSPERFIVTPPTEAYKITTMGGYETICSNIHQVFTSNGWKLGRNLTTKDKLYFHNVYQFPSDMVQDGLFTVDENVGWLMGILVAEGSINSRHYLHVHMTDKDCVERVNTAWTKLGIKNGICHKSSSEDNRGWTNKQSWTSYVCNVKLRDKLEALGLERTTSHNKRIPWSILQSPKSVMVAFLAGLFEGDGSAFLWTDRKTTNKLGVAYYSVSETLCREVQIILQKFNIFCTRQSRASKLSDKPQWMLRLNGINALRLCELLQIKKWETVYNACLKDESCMVTFPKYLKVKSVVKLPGKRNLYDFHLPKTHSFMGNCFCQHNSIPRETFETVVAGFGVVELEPYDKVERAAEIRVLKRLGQWSADMEEAARVARMGNQSIISGTAYYQFNHFAEYWKRWHGIIMSKGDKNKLAQVIGKDAAQDVDWRDYKIIRLPVTLLPDGYMDERHVARSKATVHSGIFLNEFGAVFSSDSNGFFKRSLVEQCVTNKPIEVGGEWIQFRCVTKGNPNGRYVYGVDPASENDKFSIVIMEIHDTHQRIVYCWTTDKAEHTKRIESGMAVEPDFYGFCARKIRELMKVFPCDHIAMDSQGGGIAVREALHDTDKLHKGEFPIWEIKSSHPFSISKIEKATDRYSGLHILELCNFARSDYTAEANHGLRKDFEDRVTLFPMSNDTSTLAVAFEQDQVAKRYFDTYENCFDEIEELKEELATIVHTQTAGSNRDRWDTPEIKLAGSRKGRLRKDRYSALVMANYAARRFARKPEEVPYQNFGGFVGSINHNTENSPAYLSGPDWFVNPANGNVTGFGKIIRRGVK